MILGYTQPPGVDQPLINSDQTLWWPRAERALFENDSPVCQNLINRKISCWMFDESGDHDEVSLIEEGAPSIDKGRRSVIDFSW